MFLISEDDVLIFLVFSEYRRFNCFFFFSQNDGQRPRVRPLTEIAWTWSWSMTSVRNAGNVRRHLLPVRPLRFKVISADSALAFDANGSAVSTGLTAGTGPCGVSGWTWEDRAVNRSSRISSRLFAVWSGLLTVVLHDQWSFRLKWVFDFRLLWQILKNDKRVVSICFFVRIRFLAI